MIGKSLGLRSLFRKKKAGMASGEQLEVYREAEYVSIRPYGILGFAILLQSPPTAEDCHHSTE